ncbi:MAG: glycoside hydrolase family 3 C-terminal domain-containing protein [Bacteroidales bacterium]
MKQPMLNVWIRNRCVPVLAFFLSVLLSSCTTAPDVPPTPLGDGSPIYLNTNFSFEERAADLVSRLTLEEKQSLMGNTMAAVPRLGIHAYNVWGEALHGYASFFNPTSGPATSFPNSVALGASWDPDLMEREAVAISEECRGFNAGVIHGLTFWSPVVEPVRDPRWGRTGESFGEDPFLISRIAGGFVRGMMGDDPTYVKAFPTGKHYFANNSEFNRHMGSSNMDDRDMREYYLTPYKNLIENDRLPSIMTCYNAVNGVPVTANPYLVDSVARKTYGLEGYVTSDCGGVTDIFTGHKYAKSNAEAAAYGLKAGVDTDCGQVYQTRVLEALSAGLIEEADMDRALHHVFTVRMRSGEFDPPVRVPYASIGRDVINSAAHADLALEVAQKTPVLLKNERLASGQKALPLDAGTLRTLAVIGPQADKVELGPYSGRPLEENMITPLAGIRAYLAEQGVEARVVHSSGANTTSLSNLFNVYQFDMVGADGSLRSYDATEFSAAAPGIALGSGIDPRLAVKNIKDGDWTAYEQVDISNLDRVQVSMVVPGDGGAIEFRVGSETGNLLASVTTKDQEGSPFRSQTYSAKINKLGLNGSQTVYLVYRAPEADRIDRATLDLARDADVAVVFVGTDDRTASEEADRLSLLLPGNQVELIRAVAEVNPHTVVVMQSLGMVEVEAFKDLPQVSGILWTGFNGQAQGAAMARILFGAANPGGKLNATWFRSVDDLPPITDYTLRGGEGNNGRTYWYYDKEVSYPFGYGLSYTEFSYANFRISRDEITPNDVVTVGVDVQNTGAVAGDEVVQVYVRTPESRAEWERPIKRLKGFQRVSIPAGETVAVEISIPCADLYFWDPAANKITFDPGRYVFEIGSSSVDIRGEVEAVLSGSFRAELKTVVAECGRIVAGVGDEIQSRVSAALSDDSFYDLGKARVRYASSNEEVARVDSKGRVVTTGPGVVSIHAFVTVNGKTVSDSYPLKVMPDFHLASLTVGGDALDVSRPGQTAFGLTLPAGSAQAPLVEATAGPGLDMDLQQAASVPGTAILTLTEPITGESRVYMVNLGTALQGDEFGEAALGAQWSWVRESPDRWSLDPARGTLRIAGEEGEISGEANSARNLLLQSANTDWTVQTSLTLSRQPAKVGQQAGLVAYQDDDNFVKLVLQSASKGFGMGMGSVYLELLVENQGAQVPSIQVPATELNLSEQPRLRLKLVREGNVYKAWYAIGEGEEVYLGETRAVLSDIRAGLVVCEGLPPRPSAFGSLMGLREMAPPEPLTVDIDWFHVLP